MRPLALILGLGLMLGATGAALAASVNGWGLPGLLDKPVSVRLDSRSRRGRGTFIYFGGRRHYGGGIHGGK